MAGDTRGATLVEFALVAPIFLMLLIGGLEVGVLGMISANFDGAVQAAARQIRTGQDDGPRDTAAFRKLICTRMMDGEAKCAQRLKVSVIARDRFAQAAPQLRAAFDDRLTAGEPFDAGGPEQVVLVTATYDWPVILPFVDAGAYERVDGTHVRLVSRFAFRNEPYL